MTKSVCLAALAALALVSESPSAQTTWYVDDDCVGAATGTSSDPFCDIQDAVDTALSGDTILVYPGTYGCVDYKGKEVRVASLEGPAVTMTGGILFGTNEGPGASIEGFTIRLSCFTGNNGIRLNGASPTIAGNVIYNNWSNSGGGGIYMYNGSSPQILHNQLRFNQALPGSSPSSGSGGGMYISASTPYLEGNVFYRNSVFADFGNGYGGAIYVTGSTVTMRSNLFDTNLSQDEAANHGGAIYGKNSTLTLEANTFVDNSATGFGAPPPPGWGGALYLDSCVTNIRNSVFWSDVAPVGQEIHAVGGVINLAYSNVDQGLPGITGTATVNWNAGMTTVDPLLDGTRHLTAASPMIDAGSPAYEFGGTDGDVEPRVLDGDADGVVRIDVGWDELGPTQLTLLGSGVLGTSLDFTTDGTAGQFYALAASPGTGDLTYKSFGSILLGLSGLQVVANGTVPGNDSFAVPVSSSLIGLRIYFQSVALSIGQGVGAFSKRIAVTLH